MIYINNISFEIPVDTSKLLEEFKVASSESYQWTYEDSSYAVSAAEYFTTVNDLKNYSVELTGKFCEFSEELLSDAQRAETLRNAVSWFKSEDLSLLYKVLDDPQSFGIVSIKAGSYVEDVLLDTTPSYNACIVGALAVAKLPADVTQDAVMELCAQIVDGSDIALGILDLIITRGHLEEFKAEIQRQMIER